MKRFLALIVAITCTAHVNAAPSGHIFVSNEESNSITVIDGNRLEIIDTIAIGERPRGL